MSGGERREDRNRSGCEEAGASDLYLRQQIVHPTWGDEPPNRRVVEPAPKQLLKANRFIATFRYERCIVLLREER